MFLPTSTLALIVAAENITGKTLDELHQGYTGTSQAVDFFTYLEDLVNEIGGEVIDAKSEL